jgi:hypothetical protein
VLPDRIELSTSPLPMECSTTELRQHRRQAGTWPACARRFLAQTLPDCQGTEDCQAQGSAGERGLPIRIATVMSHSWPKHRTRTLPNALPTSCAPTWPAAKRWCGRGQLTRQPLRSVSGNPPSMIQTCARHPSRRLTPDFPAWCPYPVRSAERLTAHNVSFRPGECQK